MFRYFYACSVSSYIYSLILCIFVLFDIEISSPPPAFNFSEEKPEKSTFPGFIFLKKIFR